VAEDQAALLEVVGRHLDGDAVAGKGLDAVLLHLAGRVGHDLVPGVELNAVPSIRQDLEDNALELHQFLFRHQVILSELGCHTGSSRRAQCRRRTTAPKGSPNRSAKCHFSSRAEW
jgi:hypothetical protein